MQSTRLLLIALFAMFFQQSLATVAKSVVPLIAPAALLDLNVEAALVGVFISLSALIQVFVMMGCGSVIRRFGGVRVSQIGLFLIFLGVCFAATGWVWPFLLTAVLVPLGTSPTTPASSQILARYAPARLAGLVFSAKQTAVPFGLTVAGFVMPFFVHSFGWQGAFVAFGVICILFAAILQPVRAELDSDRDPTRKVLLGDFKTTFMAVTRDRELRKLSFAACAYVGLQSTFLTFFLLFLTETMHYTLADAGGVFAMATAASIPMRVVWGYLGGTWMSPRSVLILLGAIMAIASALVGSATDAWSYWQLAGAAFLLSSTALSWQGVLLAEIVRHSPKGEIGSMTGGVLAISAIGQMALPLLFSAMLAGTGSYAWGFYLVALPPLLVVALYLKKT
jgi:MFS family permease